MRPVYVVPLLVFGLLPAVTAKTSDRDIRSRFEEPVHVAIVIVPPGRFKDFTYTTTGDQALTGATGAFGVGMMVGKANAKGADEVAAHALQDPAVDLREMLSKYLREQYPNLTLTTQDPPNDQVSGNPSADSILIELHTESWGLYCYWDDCKHGRVSQVAQITIRDLTTRKKLAKYEYKVFVGEENSRTIASEYRENEASLLKEDLIKTATLVLSQFLDGSALRKVAP